MKKSTSKPKLLNQLVEQKKEQQKSGPKPKPFGQFQNKKQRNENNSNVGPSWGGRKGN